MRFLRLNEVKERVGLGRTSIYKLIGEGKFPKPVHVLGRNVAWIDSEIDEWMMDRIDHERTNSVYPLRY
ncbi:AlpA family transcriptional regulator [Idiomarina sp. HP20-50]|uniref:AlpA family transcriptional regulator n=1 Tax=Idiomarina sp. HP20-50 TaxID=3070813 RepID=UPI00294ADD4C|nr:AlpA family transcriptional regulator [Idiomarina sp. HP20-50]MDV6316235.1 AlpA family transcriptional regulator [Idiomarina sp. HP20-50]